MIAPSGFCMACGVALSQGQNSVSGMTNCGRSARARSYPAIISFFFPGLGPVYNGDTLMGFAIYIGAITGMFLFLVPGMTVWICGLYDSYTTATKMNEGNIPYREAGTIVVLAFIAVVLIIGAFAVVFGIGL